ncbi:hypothetical protein Tco_0601086 [Tanacetum coccineum]
MNLVTKLAERIGVLEDDLRKTKKTYSSTFTKLILRFKKLEARVKIGKARKRAKVVLSEDDEDVEDDSSKQGRKLSDAEVQEKASTETEPIIQEVTPTEVIQDQESSEKGSAEVSTAGATKGTASEVPVIRANVEKVWDFNQHIEPMDMEHGSEKMKSSEKIEEEDVDTQKEMKEVVKESGAKRKKSLPRKRRTVKRQKLEMMLRSEESKGDGSSKNYKVLIKMLEDFDRQDAEELYILVKERYSASIPEGYDLMLWGDLHTLFEPDEEDEI